VQLQKALFLLSRNLTPGQLQSQAFYEFEPYDYGPFCQQVYSDAEQLQVAEYVSVTRPDAQSYRQYAVTVAGANHAQTLRGQLPEAVREYLDQIVRWVRGLSFESLIQAIYAKYPDMKVNSVFRG
jgi:hypothetical protein